jgi:hypothetical protein
MYKVVEVLYEFRENRRGDIQSLRKGVSGFMGIHFTFIDRNFGMEDFHLFLFKHCEFPKMKRYHASYVFVYLDNIGCR